MQDIFDQLLGYLKGIWNKRWTAMFIAWVISIVGWGVIYKLPDQFQSNAKIYIDTESLLKPLLKGLTVQTNVAQEIRLMVKTLLTRPNVEKIIRLSDLDLQVQNETEHDKLVLDLQEDIQFKKVPRTRENLYNLSYKNIDPQVAQRVLQAVITVFVENSIGQSKEDTISAKNFLDKQINEYEKRLAMAENNLKLFKQKNIGVLPSTAGDYYARMETAKGQLEQTKLQLKEAQRRKKAIQMELAELVNALKHAEKGKNSGLLKTSFDARIENLNGELDDMLLKYTDSHPDIKAVRRVLTDLEAKRDAELNALQKSVVSGGNALETNPIYQELKISLGTTNTYVVSLNVRLVEFQKRFDELTKMVDHIPEVEAQLSALNRDYDITKMKYEELLNRRESANISERIDKTTDSVQFNVLEQPRVENKPVGPNRILLSSLVLVLGMGAGIGLAFVLSQLKPVFNSAKELEKFAALPILGSVSAVTSPGQRRRRALLVMTYMSLFSILIFTYAAVIAWHKGVFVFILEDGGYRLRELLNLFAL